MKKGLAFFLGLVTGGTASGLLMNMVLKQKYAQKADDEIAACRGAFLAELAKRRAEQEQKEAEEKKEAAKEAIETYSPEPEKAAEVVEKASEPRPRAYEISPEILEDSANPHPVKEIRFYSNGSIVRQEDQDVVEMTPDETTALIGMDARTLFDEDTDRICIRNDTSKVDYDIYWLLGSP